MRGTLSEMTESETSRPAELDLDAQIAKLKEMKDGWLDEDAKAPDFAGLDWLAVCLKKHGLTGYPFPYIYPTYEGGVQIEWHLRPWDPSLEIDLTDKTGYWHVLNYDTEDSEEKDLDLSKDENWVWIVEQMHGKGRRQQKRERIKPYVKQ